MSSVPVLLTCTALTRYPVGASYAVPLSVGPKGPAKVRRRDGSVMPNWSYRLYSTIGPMTGNLWAVSTVTPGCNLRP